MKSIHVCILLALSLTLLSAAEKYPWQNPHAEVLPNGDLNWKPEPFVFKKGDSTRYIDFENGNNNNDGTSQKSAWKHHPWDKNATGKAKACNGIHTYVFKRGVIYRGSLVASESGEAGNPIRLTSDPSWGDGEATLSGSELVSNWKKGAHAKMPDGDKVWSTKVDVPPRMIWVIKDGKVINIPIARTPNWTITDNEDTLSNWFEWENPVWWKNENVTTTVGKKKMKMGTDRKNLTEDTEYYQGGIIWSEWSVVMGTPFPSQIEAVPSKGQLAFQGMWWGTSTKLRTGHRYFIEDKPHYLDSAGEHWYDKKSKTLYIRLPGDANPNEAHIEVAKRYSIIEDTASAKAPPRLDVLREKANDPNVVSAEGVSHVEFSGLNFEFNNTWWDHWFPAWMHKEVTSAAIRLRGSTDAVHIHHCHFQHVICGVRIAPLNANARNGNVHVTDNVFEYTGDAAVHLSRGRTSVEHVDFLRNKCYMIGMRPDRQSSGHAVNINFPTTMHVAGNMLKRTYGSGLFLFGGKGSGQAGDFPLSRHLVHHNKVEDSLLRANDWGGIETWQGGPFYLFSNISANPGGLWQGRMSKDTFNSRLGFAYYLDGGFKNYLFNNIAWGRNNDRGNSECNAYAFYEAVGTIHNNFINNTIYRFASGSSWSPRGGHHHFVGNLWSDITDRVYHHGKLKEDKSKSPKEYPHNRMAYGPDVFHEIKGDFGQFENLTPVDQRLMKNFESMEAAVKKNQTINASLGTQASGQVMRDPANKDMRPTKDSTVIDKGAVHFIPWSLYGMVAEWNFYHDGKDVNKILDEHWYLNDYLTNRATYHEAPQYPLTVVNTTAANFVDGPLENWAKGALELNGENQYATIKHSDIDKPYTYTHRKQTKTVEGTQLKNVDIHDNNFLIEVYLKTKAGQNSGIIVKKMGETGYNLSLNKNGGVTLKVTAKESASIDSKGKINDGKWHHVIVEADRKAKTFTVYIDGKKDNSGAGVGLVSLCNTADLFVGGSEKGDCLAGTFEFMRICHGTIKDARTTIDELYTWQFDGPQHRDFVGNKPNGPRDAGALEYVD